MTPDALAYLHQAAFLTERPWRAAEFADLLQSHNVALYAAPFGFALTRAVAGESELLTLAVHPDHQRKGIARALILEWLADTRGHAEDAFLEVAADNTGAIALYESHDFAEVGRRRAYYARKSAAPTDAIVMRLHLT